MTDKTPAVQIHPDDQHNEDLRRVVAGLQDPEQRDIATLGLATVATLLRKNTDYGGSVFQAPTLCPKLDPSSAILVRLSDKVQRLSKLQSGASPQVDESITDTVGDMAGYSILYIVQRAREDAHGATGADVTGEGNG